MMKQTFCYAVLIVWAIFKPFECHAGKYDQVERVARIKVPRQIMDGYISQEGKEKLDEEFKASESGLTFAQWVWDRFHRDLSNNRGPRWLPGVPETFNWQTYARRNSSVLGVSHYTLLQRGHMAQKHFLQSLEMVSYTGDGKILPWMPIGLGKNLDAEMRLRNPGIYERGNIKALADLAYQTQLRLLEENQQGEQFMLSEIAKVYESQYAAEVKSGKLKEEDAREKARCDWEFAYIIGEATPSQAYASCMRFFDPTDGQVKVETDIERVRNVCRIPGKASPILNELRFIYLTHKTSCNPYALREIEEYTRRRVSEFHVMDFICKLDPEVFCNNDMEAFLKLVDRGKALLHEEECSMEFGIAELYKKRYAADVMTGKIEEQDAWEKARSDWEFFYITGQVGPSKQYVEVMKLNKYRFKEAIWDEVCEKMGMSSLSLRFEKNKNVILERLDQQTEARILEEAQRIQDEVAKVYAHAYAEDVERGLMEEQHGWERARCDWVTACITGRIEPSRAVKYALLFIEFRKVWRGFYKDFVGIRDVCEIPGKTAEILDELRLYVKFPVDPGCIKDYTHFRLQTGGTSVSRELGVIFDLIPIRFQILKRILPFCDKCMSDSLVITDRVVELVNAGWNWRGQTLEDVMRLLQQFAEKSRDMSEFAGRIPADRFQPWKIVDAIQGLFATAHLTKVEDLVEFNFDITRAVLYVWASDICDQIFANIFMPNNDFGFFAKVSKVPLITLEKAAVLRYQGFPLQIHVYTEGGCDVQEMLESSIARFE